MSTVAIEISPNRILLAAGTAGGKGEASISHAVEIPLTENATDQEVAGLIQKAVEDHGLARSEVVFIVARGESELREMELPPAPDDELPDMVRFKAKSDFASFSDRWLLDYISLNEDESIPRKVLASAIPSSLKERIEKIVQPSGLKLKQIVLRPFAVMDLLRQRITDRSGRLVINRGDQFVDVVVALGKDAVSARSIRVAKDHTAEQISQQLLSEVRRTIASSKRQLEGAKISDVILLDDERKNRHLIGNLQQRMGIEVSCLDPFDEAKKTRPFDSTIDDPWMYSPLIGSLKQQSGSEPPAFNFLNPRQKQEVKTDRSRWIFYGSLAGVTAVAIVLIGWFVLYSQSSEIASLSEQLAEKIKLNDSTNNSPSVDERLERAALIDNWKKNDVQWLDELEAMSNRFLTADEVIVSSFDAGIRQSKPDIKLSGRIKDTAQERKLFKSLESRPYSVTPTTSKFEGSELEYPYTFANSLTRQIRGNSWLTEIDNHVREFNERLRNSEKLVSQPSETNEKEAN